MTIMFYIGDRPTYRQLLEANLYEVTTPSGPPKKGGKARSEAEKRVLKDVKKQLKRKSDILKKARAKDFQESVEFLGEDFLDHYGHDLPQQLRESKKNIFRETESDVIVESYIRDEDGSSINFRFGGPDPFDHYYIDELREDRIMESRAKQLGNKIKARSLFIKTDWSY